MNFTDVYHSDPFRSGGDGSQIELAVKLLSLKPTMETFDQKAPTLNRFRV